MKSLLVADSGGSGTDWSYTNTKGETTYFTTRSYHPNGWGDEFVAQEKEYWNSQSEMKNASVKFFGAGCLNRINAEQLKQYFASWGFDDVQVLSDIHAAGIASFGKENGSVVIMGTGSVMAKMEAGEIVQIKGGLGYLLGDEGSGYFFGKLLLSEYLNGSIECEETNLLIASTLGGNATILSNVYGKDGKSYISSLSKVFSQHDTAGLNSIHEQNIAGLIKLIKCPSIHEDEGLYFVGSYCFNKKDTLLTVLKNEHVLCAGVLEKPIYKLTEYLLKVSF